MTTIDRNTNVLTDATPLSPRGSQPKHSGRSLRVTVAALVFALASIFVTAQGAFAWSYGVGTGTRGNVSLPTIYVGDLIMPSGITAFTLYGNTGPIVGRNPASTGDQTAGAKYFVEQFDGAKWVIVAQSPLLSGQIRAGQTGIQLPAPYLQPFAARGYFRFRWQFAWTTSTGTALGSTDVVSNLVGDHVCVTKIRLCQPYAGYVRTGLNRTSW
jgi:hypothetical protein